MQKSGGGFQKWKYFPRKKLGRLLTHALPNNTKALTPLPLPNPNPNQPNQITPTKTPTTIEISTHINPNLKQTQTQNPKTPQNPKIIQRSNKLIINNR